MKGVTLQNRYRIESELGHGGMGVVYRAHDTLLDRAVAVKVLSDSGLGTEGRARLLREAQAAAKLDHPNIVAVYDAGEAEDIPFIVMQLVEGQSLHDQPPQALDEILAIARQICLALEHAHAHGIIHRDLKPENILVTRLPSPETGGSVSGDPLMGAGGAGVRAKLMDFGLARSTASRLTAEGALVGTVFYLAPEQALGQEIDGRADLYSLGVVLYELVARRLPFTGDDPLTVISQHLYAPVVPPSTYNPEIPPALDALLLKLLAKDPADRFASAAEARQALESLDRSSAAVPTAVEVSPIDRIAR
ncbi:MAG TPA: serine/threonine-protein kinase, partial [Anaerolineales bacterium]|nr:serine/threonine-protein kinase [Anaerolineales bacterium]